MAGHLGMTVGELGQRMTAPEFMEWVALDSRVEPLPDAWEQTASITCAVLTPWTKKPMSPLDFMPWRKRKKKRQTVAEMRAIMAGVAARANARATHGGHR